MTNEARELASNKFVEIYSENNYHSANDSQYYSAP